MSGLLTVLAFVAFIGVCVWAWSSRRTDAFREAAAMPLRDELNEYKADQDGGAA